MNRRDFLKTTSGLFVPLAPAVILPKRALAQSPVLPGPGLPHATGGGGYTGPMDVTGYTSPYACWSLRAGSAAIAAAATQNLIDIVDQAGANPLTVKVLATGNLDTASISTWVTAHSVTTIQVLTLYDQSVNGRNFTQSSGSAPTLVLNSLNGKAVLVFTAASNQFMATVGVSAQAQPLTVSAIMNPIGTSGGRILSSNGGDIQFGYDTSGSNDFLYAGTVETFTPVTGWQSVVGVFNDPSTTTINLSNASNNPSGTPSTLGGSAGAAGISNLAQLSLGNRSPAVPDLPGNFDLFEMLLNASAVSAANQASLVANQRSYGAY